MSARQKDLGTAGRTESASGPQGSLRELRRARDFVVSELVRARDELGEEVGLLLEEYGLSGIAMQAALEEGPPSLGGEQDWGGALGSGGSGGEDLRGVVEVYGRRTRLLLALLRTGQAIRYICNTLGQLRTDGSVTRAADQLKVNSAESSELCTSILAESINVQHKISRLALSAPPPCSPFARRVDSPDPPAKESDPLMRAGSATQQALQRARLTRSINESLDKLQTSLMLLGALLAEDDVTLRRICRSLDCARGDRRLLGALGAFVLVLSFGGSALALGGRLLAQFQNLRGGGETRGEGDGRCPAGVGEGHPDGGLGGVGSVVSLLGGVGLVGATYALLTWRRRQAEVDELWLHAYARYTEAVRATRDCKD